jgi:hypothetical protein
MTSHLLCGSADLSLVIGNLRVSLQSDDTLLVKARLVPALFMHFRLRPARFSLVWRRIR